MASELESKLNGNINATKSKTQSEIDELIDKALNEIKQKSPCPPLESVSLNKVKQEEIENKTKSALQSTNNDESKTTNDEKDKHNNCNDDKKKRERAHKHNKKITWETCHSFTADCHLCKNTITDYEEYCKHLKYQHYDIDDNLEWLTCDVCGKMNAHKSNFISHLASHTGKKPFKCRIVLTSGEYCATQASTRQNLQTHILKVHKMSVKHKLQIHKKSPSKHDSSSSPDKKKKKKKKKKSKKRRYRELNEDCDFEADDEFDINNPAYGYTYKPRKAKKHRPHRKLTVKQQKNSPYCHPMEILIAAACYVEINKISHNNNINLKPQDMKQAAKYWNKLLDHNTITNLQNIANQIDDISTTKQII